MAEETTFSFGSAEINGYTVRTAGASNTLSTGTNSIVSETINVDTDDIENKKIIVGMDVTSTFDTAASGTVTVTNATTLTDSGAASISIITAEGTTITATANTGHPGSASTCATTDTPLFNVTTGSVTTTAAAIVTAINPHAEISATNLAGVITITQRRGGTAGNTAITLVDPGTAGLSKVDFTGGLNTDLLVQASHDGINWTTAATASSTVAGTAGFVSYTTDLTNVYSPYFRLKLNSVGVALGTTGTTKLFFAYT